MTVYTPQETKTWEERESERKQVAAIEELLSDLKELVAKCDKVRLVSIRIDNDGVFEQRIVSAGPTDSNMSYSRPRPYATYASRNEEF